MYFSVLQILRCFVVVGATNFRVNSLHIALVNAFYLLLNVCVVVAVVVGDKVYLTFVC